MLGVAGEAGGKKKRRKKKKKAPAFEHDPTDYMNVPNVAAMRAASTGQ